MMLQDLREKIQALEAERTRLLVEIGEMRKAAESRVAALESEVGQMREEAKALRELLGNSKVTISAPNVQKNQISSAPS
ncbi:MAG: hypothetical protein NWF00_07695 [Candidatus Bathyarchaeota archaeon]|nr:hypothetical protein [Candidatus Bathyarchaeota archaeon]